MKLNLDWKWLFQRASVLTSAAIAAEVILLMLMSLEWHVRAPLTTIAAFVMGCAVMVLHYFETHKEGRPRYSAESP